MFKAKEYIRTKHDQLSDIEKNILIEHGKRNGKNKRQSLELKTEAKKYTEIMRRCCHIS